MAVKLAKSSKSFKSFNLIDSKHVEIVEYNLIKALLFLRLLEPQFTEK